MYISANIACLTNNVEAQLSVGLYRIYIYYKMFVKECSFSLCVLCLCAGLICTKLHKVAQRWHGEGTCWFDPERASRELEQAVAPGLRELTFQTFSACCRCLLHNAKQMVLYAASSVWQANIQGETQDRVFGCRKEDCAYLV